MREPVKQTDSPVRMGILEKGNSDNMMFICIYAFSKEQNPEKVYSNLRGCAYVCVC